MTCRLLPLFSASVAVCLATMASIALPTGSTHVPGEAPFATCTATYADSTPPTLLVYDSNLDVFSSPHYKGGRGSATDPAVLRIPGCLNTFIVIRDLTIDIEFRGLKHAARTPLSAAQEANPAIPAQCLGHETAYCIQNTAPWADVHLRDFHLNHDVELVTLANGHATLLQTPGQPFARGGSLGHVYDGLLAVQGVRWHDIDQTTTIHGGTLRLLASDLHAEASTCQDTRTHDVPPLSLPPQESLTPPAPAPHDETRQVYQPILSDLAPPDSNVAGVPITPSPADPLLAILATMQVPETIGQSLDDLWNENLAQLSHVKAHAVAENESAEGELDLTLFQVEEDARIEVLGTALGGAFKAIDATQASVLSLQSTVACSAWGILAQESSVTSIRTRFTDTAIPYHLTSELDFADALADVDTVNPLWALSRDQPIFRSVCDMFHDHHPATVITDSPITLLGPGFADGVPLPASLAATGSRTYGGMQNVVPVPDNVEYRLASYDPADAGACPGPFSSDDPVMPPAVPVDVPTPPKVPRRCELTPYPYDCLPPCNAEEAFSPCDPCTEQPGPCIGPECFTLGECVAPPPCAQWGLPGCELPECEELDIDVCDEVPDCQDIPCPCPFEPEPLRCTSFCQDHKQFYPCAGDCFTPVPPCVPICEPVEGVCLGDKEESEGPQAPMSSSPLPTWTLLGAGGNPVLQQPGNLQTTGILNVPLVDPSLTYVHYLVGLPLPGPTKIFGFYNFAVPLALNPLDEPSFGFDISGIAGTPVRYWYEEGSYPEACSYCFLPDDLPPTLDLNQWQKAGLPLSYMSCLTLWNQGAILEAERTQAPLGCDGKSKGTSSSTHHLETVEATADIELVPGPNQVKISLEPSPFAGESSPVPVNITQGDGATGVARVEFCVSRDEAFAALGFSGGSDETGHMDLDLTLTGLEGGCQEVSAGGDSSREGLTVDLVTSPNPHPQAVKHAVPRLELLDLHVEASALANMTLDLAAGPWYGPKSVYLHKDNDTSDVTFQSTQLDNEAITAHVEVHHPEIAGGVFFNANLVHAENQHKWTEHHDGRLKEFAFEATQGYIGDIEFQSQIDFGHTFWLNASSLQSIVGTWVNGTYDFNATTASDPAAYDDAALAEVDMKWDYFEVRDFALTGITDQTTFRFQYQNATGVWSGKATLAQETPWHVSGSVHVTDKGAKLVLADLTIEPRVAGSSVTVDGVAGSEIGLGAQDAWLAHYLVLAEFGGANVTLEGPVLQSFRANWGADEPSFQLEYPPDAEVYETHGHEMTFAFEKGVIDATVSLENVMGHKLITYVHNDTMPQLTLESQQSEPYTISMLGHFDGFLVDAFVDITGNSTGASVLGVGYQDSTDGAVTAKGVLSQGAMGPYRVDMGLVVKDHALKVSLAGNLLRGFSAEWGPVRNSAQFQTPLEPEWYDEAAYIAVSLDMFQDAEAGDAPLVHASLNLTDIEGPKTFTFERTTTAAAQTFVWQAVGNQSTPYKVVLGADITLPPDSDVAEIENGALAGELLIVPDALGTSVWEMMAKLLHDPDSTSVILTTPSGYIGPWSLQFLDETQSGFLATGNHVESLCYPATFQYCARPITNLSSLPTNVSIQYEADLSDLETAWFQLQPLGGNDEPPATASLTGLGSKATARVEQHWQTYNGDSYEKYAVESVLQGDGTTFAFNLDDGNLTGNIKLVPDGAGTFRLVASPFQKAYSVHLDHAMIESLDFVGTFSGRTFSTHGAYLGELLVDGESFSFQAPTHPAFNGAVQTYLNGSFEVDNEWAVEVLGADVYTEGEIVVHSFEFQGLNSIEVKDGPDGRIVENLNLDDGGYLKAFLPDVEDYDVVVTEVANVLNIEIDIEKTKQKIVWADGFECQDPEILVTHVDLDLPGAYGTGWLMRGGYGWSWNMDLFADDTMTARLFVGPDPIWIAGQPHWPTPFTGWKEDRLEVSTTTHPHEDAWAQAHAPEAEVAPTHSPTFASPC